MATPATDDLEFEPIPGLPGRLPPGERILWQGRPRWQRLARDAFRIRGIAIYFALFTVIRGVAAWQDGRTVGAALFASAVVLPLAAACLGLLALLAWMNARATMYTITTRRVVMRIGVAISISFNLPYKRLAAADLKANGDGTGDISLELLGKDRIAWLHLWPHARPWRMAKAQPTLRAIPDAARVAALLGQAVRVSSTTASEQTAAAPAAEAA